MKINLVGQPRSDSSNLYQFLTSGSREDRYTHLRIATAWAKQSGLMRVEEQLLSFRSRGGQIVSVVGISEGGATRQGLHLVHKICDASYVFHDAGRTFHPKVYFFNGASEWNLFIGSNNLTAGGTFWNYEAALELSGAYGESQERAMAGEITDWFDSLTGDSEVCKPLTLDFIKTLIESPEYRIGDEIRMRSRQRTDSRGKRTAPTLFGKSRNSKQSDPFRKTAKSVTQQPPSQEEYPDLLDEPATPSEIIAHSWFKKMSPSDAQRPKGDKSKATGNLKLTQANHPIDQKTYFRAVFFAGTQWGISKKTPRGVQEKSTVSFEVLVGTKVLGTYNLVIDHADYRVAGQGNVPTWLHWGEALGAYLKSHDHAGDYITVERFEDGSFRLTISSDPVGEIRAPKEGI